MEKLNEILNRYNLDNMSYEEIRNVIYEMDDDTKYFYLRLARVCYYKGRTDGSAEAFEAAIPIVKNIFK